MASVKVYDIEGKEVETLELNDSVFGVEINEHLMHLAVVGQQANSRQGTQSAKTRSEVSGGGRKPWRQKGTGHARQGSIRAVQWVGGGRYGTPVPRDYSKKQNRKERRLALKSAFAHKFLDGEVIVIEELVFGTPKTKEMATLLKNMKVEDKKVLFVVDQFEENVILASRNLQNVALISSDEVNVLDIVNSDVMVMTEKALKDVEEVLK